MGLDFIIAFVIFLAFWALVWHSIGRVTERHIAWKRERIMQKKNFDEISERRKEREAQNSRENHGL